MKDLIKLIDEQKQPEYAFQMKRTTCDSILDHDVSWCGDCYACNNCGKRFIWAGIANEMMTTTIRTLLEAEVVRLKDKLRDLEQIEKECRTKKVLPAKRKRAVSVAFGNNKAIEAEITHTQQLLDELNAT